ncbi:glutamine amidotransferase [Xylella fastidiosa subsp. fastidiosa]|jgi:anthranilate synthase component 1|nr:glutamine amidotransferase [Xylella fastidiosa]ADN63900.1 anthranilate synthase component I [Xylella fastidiosa subsp. fastidiosa GB514]EGO81848.1 Anthranilate/para-aminobenzoate synthase component I [Xylella fastidiosa EB92.1]KGM21075.1 anthranilate synthase [Xylella fastidiosa]MBE0262851.1 glutamine amidotransferase [Xylella fastidiosa subsp. fastidiosa]MBE0263927.1 glutamine amidotransferase [Xylella fastidiosa subsp. fastidiosa]
MVWQFLKEFEKNFSQVPTHQCGIMAFSCFSYETIHYIETIPETELNDQDDHDITLILYQSQLVIEQNKAELITYSFPGVEDFYVANIIDAITCMTDVEQVQDKSIDFEVIQETTRHDYLDKVRKALHHVTVGDIYQVQIGQKIQVKAETTPLDVYRRLRILNPSP